MNKTVRIAELQDEASAPVNPYAPADPYAPRPDASKQVAAQKRAAQPGRPIHDTEPITPLRTRTRLAVPFGVGSIVLIALMIGAASYQLAQLGSARPLAVTPGPSTQAFLGTPTAEPSDMSAIDAPTSTPELPSIPRATPIAPENGAGDVLGASGTGRAQIGRGLTIDSAAPTPTPEPPAEPTAAPSYVENVGAQAPHCIRTCDGQPGPSGGDWALVPTVAPAMLEVIGNQAPHKVR